MHTIYLAHSSRRLCKTFRPSTKGPVEDKDAFSPGKLFKYEKRTLTTFQNVYELLCGLADDPHRAIVMGKPLIIEGERNSDVFEEAKSRLWFIDLDGVPIYGDVQSTIEHCLPFIVGHSYIYAHSQSAGFKKGLRCRVICVIPEMNGATQSAYARHYNNLLVADEGKTLSYIDCGIYGPSRLLLTSRPALFGIDDPYPDRVHFVAGDNAPVQLAALPEMVTLSVPGNKIDFTDLPSLSGFGKHGGEGQDRSIQALKAIGRLKAHMGDDWSDPIKRATEWELMLQNAKATEYEWSKYKSFVNERANDARVPSGQKETLAVANPDHSIPLPEAERELKAVIRNAVADPVPKVTAVCVTTGLGKTEETLKQLAAHYRYLEETNPLNVFNIDFYIPTIILGEEILQTAKKYGLEGYVEYGRGQTVGGKPVCDKFETSNCIQGLVENVASFICKNKEDGTCEAHDRCLWQWQRNETSHIPLRIRSHHYLPLIVLPEHQSNYRPTDFVVIDEASFIWALSNNERIPIKDFIAPRLTGENYEWVLKFARLIDQGLTIDGLEGAGFTIDVCDELAKAEEALKPLLDINPTMSPETSKRVAAKFETKWQKYVMVWLRLRECLLYRTINPIQLTDDTIKLAWRTPIESIPWDDEKNRPRVPVLILSATLRRSAIEQFIPVDNYIEIDVEPHENAIIEQSDLKGSKSECLFGVSESRREQGENDLDKIKSAEKVRELVATAAQGSSLITYLELRENIGAQGHFGAVEGLNEFSGRDIMVYGRPLPPPSDVEDIARAIYFDSTEIRTLKSAWYPKRPVAKRGPGFGYAEYHTDPRVEDIRLMICEGQIMQAVGRARYIRNPVRVTILNNTPLPLRIDREIMRHRLDPEWRQFESAPFLLLSQNEYRRLYPRISKDWRSMSRIIEKRKVEFCEEHMALEVSYRISGQRGPSKKALVDGAHNVPMLGNVASWEVTNNPENRPASLYYEFEDICAREGFKDEDGDPIEIVEGDQFEMEGFFITPEWSGRAIWPWVQHMQ